VPIPVRAEVEELVATSAPGRDGDIDVRIPETLETVIDRTVFDRVVSNLLTNALRHGAAPVVVTAAQSDNHFRLVVEDSGNGVPPQFVEDLFERFSRSDEARSRGQGSGLGLSIARSYARAHGGDLVHQTVRPHGARFELVVPISPSPSDLCVSSSGSLWFSSSAPRRVRRRPSGMRAAKRSAETSMATGRPKPS